ncbi:hypothetical protein MMC10_001027 [Thelotrema lepadinum]|nr:hypothetical protein [Thelotrema lepadinum]
MAYTPGSSINNLSFLFSAFDIRPNYDIHSPRHTPSTFAPLWLPPNRKEDFRPRPLDFLDTNDTLYRWAGGEITEVNKSTYPRASELNTRTSNPWRFRTYSVFVQQNNGRILAVDFDARRRDVRDSDITEWCEIGFHHIPAGNAVYSYLDIPGEYLQLAGAAPSSNATWINQLFPQGYHCGPSADAQYPTMRHAGLIGRLPLIISLAALSCHPTQVKHVLTRCMRPGRWSVHTASHHRDEKRGLVVTVWRDPAGTTTAAQLKQLEEGHFGPIIGF